MPKYTNTADLPEEIVKAVLNDPYSHGDADISVTGLIAPPQLKTLERRYYDVMTVDVSSRLYALYGQLGHNIIERSDAKDKLQEERLNGIFNGWKVSGATDLYDGGVISDYKYCSVYVDTFGGAETKPEWTQQLNIYAELWRNHDFPVTKLQIVALFRDWRKSEAKRNRNYPQTPVKVYTLSLWSVAQAQEFIYGRVQLHKEARLLTDEQLPECTEDERWARPSKWAVMKTKVAKRATKLHDTEEAAEAHREKLGDKAIIVYRPGVNIRCEDYCDVSEYCCQYAKITY
jgi:hypothetical protein